VTLIFVNTGGVAAVFQVRSGNPADAVRFYTVEPGKILTGTWNVTSPYQLSVYGPNGFARYFNASIGSTAAVLDVRASYSSPTAARSIQLTITNVSVIDADVSVLNAYTGVATKSHLEPQGTFVDTQSLEAFHGWYDLIVTVAEDPTLTMRYAGHVETGVDSFSDPALGGLVTLQV
jgi:phospholipase C